MVQKIIDKLASISNDKLLHSFYGTLLYAVISIYSSMAAIVVVFVVAIGKEIYDEYKYKGFDYNDIVATVFIPFIFFVAEFY